MTFTYVSTGPTSNKDWVRLRIGDTSSGDPLLTDEEINEVLDEEGNKFLAAAVAAETIGAQYARKVDKSVGKLSISMAQASEHYFALADRLRENVVMDTSVGGPYAGGISQADKDKDEADSDRVDPAFYVGQFDIPGSILDWSS